MVGRHAFILMLGSLVGLLALGAPPEAAAAGYPDRPITIVVPFAPGGVTDLGARALADALEKEFKQPVVVVNRPGGGTTIAGNAVATAKPDGYTLGFLIPSSVIPEVFSYFHEAPYTSKDLRPVTRVTTPVLAITVKSDAPWGSLKELVEFARRNPGMKTGTHGKNGLGYLAMRTIGKAENASFVDVPFEGDTKIVPAVLGGHVPVGTPAYPAIKGLVEGKKLKVLALILERRAEFAPEIPSIVELGYKLAYTSFNAVMAPRGTPDDVVRKLDETIRRIAAGPEFAARINNMAIQLSYEDTASFEQALARYKENIHAFFKEEGLVK